MPTDNEVEGVSDRQEFIPEQGSGRLKALKHLEASPASSPERPDDAEAVEWRMCTRPSTFEEERNPGVFEGACFHLLPGCRNGCGFLDTAPANVYLYFFGLFFAWYPPENARYLRLALGVNSI